MVATAKARKTLVNADGIYYTSHHQHPQHQTARNNNTNRRNIVGLSEAIREKAFQSTSPSSEATNGNSSSNFRSNYETAVAMRRDQERSTRKQPLTVEERLRKLLHSEAESTDAEQSYIENKFSNNHYKKTSKMPLRLRSKTPTPHVANTHHSATLNRNANYRQQMENYNEEQKTMASAHHNTSQPNHQVSARSQYFHTSQRRCKSAVPAAFHDHDWNNKISEKPAANPPTSNHHQMPAHHPHQQHHVNNSNKTCKSEQNLIKSQQRQQQQQQQQQNLPMTSYQIVGRAPPGGGKPVPAVRRSLHADSGFDSSRSTTNNNHEQQPQQPQTHSNYNNKKQQQQRNTYVIKSQLSLANQYDDVTVAVHPPPYGSVPHVTEPAMTSSTRQGSHHHQHHPASATSDSRRCMTPAPDKRRAMHRQRDQSPAIVTSSVATSRHATTPTSSRKSKESKSSQQNISFRRAIRATSSDENLHASSQRSAAPPRGGGGGVVNRMTSSGQTSLSSCATTKATRKSDDRDSGAVLHETPGSVFDFESSVFGELDPQQQQRRHHSSHLHHDGTVSRSDTPLLPPLDDDVINDEEDSMKRSHQHPEVYSGLTGAATTGNNLTVVAGYKVPTLPHKKKEDHFPTASNISSNNHKIRDDAVSNLIDFVKIEERKQQQQQQQQQQRGARYRGVGGADEKDEVETKLQQQAPSNCNCSSQKNSQEQVGSRGAAFNPLQDLYESESIFSLTTASVCSSALRGRGKRHRHGSSSKRGAGGGQGKGDKYAKEIRSINKRFSRLETHVISLARTLAQLGNDIRHQSVSAHQIDHLRNEVKELRTRQESMEQQQQQTPAHKAPSKKNNKESSKPKMNKFTKFFSEPQQPSLLNLFLKRLGYEKYVKNFQQQSIGMSELPYMEEKQLEAIGIPLGPRSRILTEARKSSFV